MRGLKTLALRMDRHCANAQAVAQFLQDHPAVAWVAYPGLASFAQHALAARQMKLPGGMIAFELKGGLASGRRFMNALGLFSRAVSLGDAESLAQHPASMTHSTYTQEERAEHGIAEGLVRLSVGLEDIADLLADIAQALDAQRRTRAAPPWSRGPDRQGPALSRISTSGGKATTTPCRRPGAGSPGNTRNTRNTLRTVTHRSGTTHESYQ